jgi:hypothetical protein
VIRLYVTDGRSSVDELDKHTLVGGINFELSSLMTTPDQTLTSSLQGG